MTKQVEIKNLQLWCPDMFGSKGGIQVFSTFFLAALQDLYPDAKYDVLIKHDSKYMSGVPPPPHTSFHFAGIYPNSVRTYFFASQLLKTGLLRRPDLIIMTHLNFSVVAYWLKHLIGIPYWVVAHGIEAWDLDRPSIQRALRGAERILAVSGYTRNRLLSEQCLNPSKVSILPNTIDPAHFDIAPKPIHLLRRYGLTPEQPVILTVSRLVSSEQYKGYDTIIKAIPHVRRTIPNLRYILVGKGNDRARVEQKIKDLNLHDCVTLAGYVPEDELAAHYNLCDVFAMPSKREGFGIVYLEAMACGKPVLAGNRDGAVDALQHGYLGALVDPDNINEIAQALIQILQGEYPHTLMYQPEMLREQVINTFGFEQFKHNLTQQFQSFETILPGSALGSCR